MPEGRPHALMTDSKDWWPADYGHYGPFFIRMAWHSPAPTAPTTVAAAARTVSSVSRRSTAGPTTATSTRRAAALADQAEVRRKISWADLMILAGNVALESMGFKTFGFAGGARDVWAAEEDVYWGPRPTGSTTSATAATATLEPARRRPDGPHLRQPEGPNGNPDPSLGSRHPRDLRPHGHERRRDRGARRRRPRLRQDATAAAPTTMSAAEPEGAPMEQQCSAGRTASDRHGRSHHHVGLRRRVELHARPVGQQLLSRRSWTTSGSSPRARPATSSGRPGTRRHRARRPRPRGVPTRR